MNAALPLVYNICKQYDERMRVNKKLSSCEPAVHDMAAQSYIDSSMPPADTIASQFLLHRGEISNCLNAVELEPHLRERFMLSTDDRSYLRSEATSKRKVDYILDCVERKNLHTKFLECVRSEKAHQGHDYISALLEDRSYCSDADRRNSDELRERIEGNMTRMMDIDLPSLVPSLFSQNLVTKDEAKTLTDVSEMQNPKVLLLFDILETKGPLAYLRFLHCLSKEKSQPVHSELYELLSVETHGVEGKNVFDCPTKRVPNRLMLEGALVGDEYNQLISRFKVHHHNGDWEAASKEVDICMQSTIPEICVVGLLEDACGWVYRFNEQKVLIAISQAKEICRTKICGGNAVHLEARAEYILSGLYRYLKHYHKSMEHSKNAVVHLFNAEPGEDSAYANYNHACASYALMAEGDFEMSSFTVRQMVDDFTFAIDTARTQTVSGSNQWSQIVINHSWIRLAMVSLGSIQGVTEITHVRDSIGKASSSLSNVNISCLSNRTKCLFYQAKSDLHWRRSEVDSAVEMATLAQELAKSCGFIHELESANTRLKYLTAI